MPLMTLMPGRYYGMTMYPGYHATAYHSPIRIDAIEAIKSGRRILEIDFFNAGYADGLKDMHYSLEILKREERYMLAAIRSEERRAISLVPLDESWLGEYFPDLFPLVTDAMDRIDSFSIALDHVLTGAPLG